MKANYKNWVPKGMLYCVGVIASVFFIGFVALNCGKFNVYGILYIVLFVFFGIGMLISSCFFIFLTNLYCAFSYDGKRKISKKIIEGIAEYVEIPDGGNGLDVGCGSGALTIACAKRNPNAFMTGLDRWGKEYASFNQELCEPNARCEGVKNVKFVQGDAIKLDYPDETFDMVTSNYVYHNIVGVNKQELLKETLRVLKKNGTFVIHDIMTPARYGNMDIFIKELKEMGYEKVELINTTNGKFISTKEARFLMLHGSSLLIGKK